jgi:molybdate transport system regulatory protein
MKIAYKVWLDNDGKAFGEGPYRILKQIEKVGSLHQAAIDLNISYRKAWVMLQNAEKKLGFALIDRKVGGVAGGGSHITPSGKKFLKSYEKFRTEIEEVLEKTYQKHFGKHRSIQLF